MSDQQDLYRILEVDRQATDEEIKRSYRRLARKNHPDANPGDHAAESRFKELASAYEVLSDPERRARYDRFGTDSPRGGDPFGGGGLGDIFEAFFGNGSPFGGGGGGRNNSGPPRGEDLEAELDLNLDDVVFGAEREVTIRTAVRCETCDGSGAKEGTSPTTCQECGGAGQVRRVRQSLLGQMVTASPCGSCGGVGEIIETPCPTCDSQGRTIEQRTYSVEVPPGVDDGTTLRLTGRGAAGPRGGPAGDLYVRIRLRPHPKFRREGDDLVHDLHLPVTQAALGAHLEYETLDGTEDLVIKAGTETDTVITLRDRGVPHVRGRGRGNLLIRVVIDPPTDLDEEQEQLLRKLAGLRGEPVADPDEGFLSRIRSAFR